MTDFEKRHNTTIGFFCGVDVRNNVIRETLMKGLMGQVAK